MQETEQLREKRYGTKNRMSRENKHIYLFFKKKKREKVEETCQRDSILKIIY